MTHPDVLVQLWEGASVGVGFYLLGRVVLAVVRAYQAQKGRRRR